MKALFGAKQQKKIGSSKDYYFLWPQNFNNGITSDSALRPLSVVTHAKYPIFTGNLKIKKKRFKHDI